MGREDPLAHDGTILCMGNLYEEELQTGAYRPYIVYYHLGSKMVSMRRENQQHADPANPPVNGQFKVVGDEWAAPLW